MCYAKTSHGRLLQQFGALESEGGRATVEGLTQLKKAEEVAQLRGISVENLAN